MSIEDIEDKRKKHRRNKRNDNNHKRKLELVFSSSRKNKGFGGIERKGIFWGERFFLRSSSRCPLCPSCSDSERSIRGAPKFFFRSDLLQAKQGCHYGDRMCADIDWYTGADEQPSGVRSSERLAADHAGPTSASLRSDFGCHLSCSPKISLSRGGEVCWLDSLPPPPYPSVTYLHLGGGRP